MGLEKLSSKKCKLNELWQDEAMDRSALKDGGSEGGDGPGGRQEWTGLSCRWSSIRQQALRGSCRQVQDGCLGCRHNQEDKFPKKGSGTDMLQGGKVAAGGATGPVGGALPSSAMI